MERQSSAEEVEMKKLLERFVTDESGATAIEYGLIAAGISLAILAFMDPINAALQNIFGQIQTGLE